MKATWRTSQRIIQIRQKGLFWGENVSIFVKLLSACTTVLLSSSVAWPVLSIITLWLSKLYFQCSVLIVLYHWIVSIVYDPRVVFCIKDFLPPVRSSLQTSVICCSMSHLFSESENVRQEKPDSQAEAFAWYEKLQDHAEEQAASMNLKQKFWWLMWPTAAMESPNTNGNPIFIVCGALPHFAKSTSLQLKCSRLL